jgi:hypothetical protein
VKKLKKLILIVCIVIFSLNISLTHASENEKYPNNENKFFPTADEFYKKIDRHVYSEYRDAVFNLRKKVFYKDLNTVFKSVPNGVSGVGDGVGFSPNRQVYVFVSTGYVDGKLFHQHAVFDAETKLEISKASGTV